MNPRLAGLAAIATSLAAPAWADVVSLNFEGINATYPTTDYAHILDFYNGGMSSAGTSGTNYGVSFGSNALAICLNNTSTNGSNCSNTSRGGLGDPSSQLGGLFFLDGTETFLNFAAGFDTGFSFNYVSVSFSGSVSVYDGLNGTGNLLATLDLAPNAGSCPGYSAPFCPFSAAGVAFSGTARSISFAGVANQIVFDDITFGSVNPGPGGVPEPASWAMMLGGFGLVGGAMRSRRRAAVSFG
jgi:PEP-CTERM motif